MSGELSTKEKLTLFSIQFFLMATGCIWVMSQPSPIDLRYLNWLVFLFNLSMALMSLLFLLIALMFDMVKVWLMGESYQWL